MTTNPYLAIVIPASRYEYSDDRFDFELWAKATGPGGKRRYWRIDHEAGVLFIEMSKRDLRRACCVAVEELRHSRLGWRRLVARTAREVRYALKEASRNGPRLVKDERNWRR